jgi:hypothetical protein
MKKEEFIREVTRLVTKEDYEQYSHLLPSVQEIYREIFLKILCINPSISRAIEITVLIEGLYVRLDRTLSVDQIFNLRVTYSRINTLLNKTFICK